MTDHVAIESAEADRASPGALRAGPPSTIIKTRLGPVECCSFGEGPAVLALHGGMGGHDQGVLLLRSAIGAAGYRFVAISRPGYLGTPLGTLPTPEAQADLCAALLDALGIRDAAVVAVSAGGPCALQFALRHRDRCRAVILVSACTGRLPTRPPLAFHLMKLFARWPAAVEGMRRRVIQRPDRAARRAIADPVLRRRTVDDPVAGPLMLELQLSIFDRLSKRLPGTENDIAQFRKLPGLPLDRIRVPVLVVHGTGDRLVPFAHGLAVAEAVDGAERLFIEGGEHVCLFTHLGEIRARVAGFLAGHGLAPTPPAGII